MARSAARHYAETAGGPHVTVFSIGSTQRRRYPCGLSSGRNFPSRRTVGLPCFSRGADRGVERASWILFGQPVPDCCDQLPGRDDVDSVGPSPPNDRTADRVELGRAARRHVLLHRAAHHWR
jgi:hypothetical protein